MRIRHEGRQDNVQKQARKGTTSGKESYKDRQGKDQRQASQYTKTGKVSWLKGRQTKTQSRKGK
jgi:hypothetical protein